MNTRRSFITHVGAAAIVGSTLSDPVEASETAGVPKKEIIAGSPYPTFSRAVRCGHMIYVSGVLGQIPGSRKLASPDFAGQAHQAMENLKASVEAAGSRMDRVVKCSAFLTEQSDFATFNEIYVAHFPSEPPARSTVIVKALVAPGAKIEIDCITIV